MAESPIRSSFIPKDAAAPSKTIVRKGGLYDLFMLISIVLVIASIVLAVGVFLYVQFLQTESASKLAQLQRAKAAFEPALIQKLMRLDDRMHVADDLLANHLAPIMVLQILEQTTLQTVSYGSFNFDSGDSQNTSIKMAGTAQSVNSIALQADLFSKSSVLTSPIFSGVNRSTSGVAFSVSALINPALVRYSSLITAGQATVAPAPAIQTGSSTPFTRPAPAAQPVKQ
jgi:hypothetical protein